MVHFSKSLLVFGALAASTQAAPLFQKRIAQVISASTAKWEQACLAAGGGEKCNPVSVTAFTTLLAAAGPCEQQDSADAMIDLAKTLNNDATMITLTQIFAQQPRNTPNSVAVPYCQTAPKNSELNGLFQCQYQGADQKNFVGGLALGSPGTIPFGMTAALNPLGSCKANPSGPIADGTQLVDLTQDPGVGSSGGSSSGSSGATTPATDTGSGSSDNGGNGDNGNNSPDDGSDNGDNCPDDGSDNGNNGSDNGNNGSDCPDDGSDNGDNGDNGGSTSTPAATSTDAAPATQTPSGSTATGGASGFQEQNGKDAQALNQKFASLTADSSCTDGDQACIGGGFAQCVGGKFAVTPCSGGTQCFALPLVNKPGTSLACDTQADATARFAASGVTGGITGSG